MLLKYEESFSYYRLVLKYECKFLNFDMLAFRSQKPQKMCKKLNSMSVLAILNRF